MVKSEFFSFLQVTLQTGCPNSADEVLFRAQRRWSVAAEPIQEGLLGKERAHQKANLKRQSISDFLANVKESDSINGCSLEHLVEAHRRTANTCKLCQEDANKESNGVV